MHDPTRLGDAIVVDRVPGTQRLFERPDALIVAVPLYRSPELLPDLADALLAMADELAALSATVVFLNDSPDDRALEAMLAETVGRLRDTVRTDVLINDANMGFTATANRALSLALATDRDVILLNSDARPRPGAFAEMLDGAYSDPLVAVVSPRSDNATLCDSPIPAALRMGDRDTVWLAHRTVAEHLPRFGYAPTAVGFCMLVKRQVIAEFGLFDLAYGAGYNEENDYVRRVNRRGYRALLANRAYVHHIGEASFAKSPSRRADREAANERLLIARYPEYERSLARHFGGAAYQAERVVSGLVPVDGRLRITFDCRVLGTFFNGTFEHLRRLLTAFAAAYAARYDIRILCGADAFRFHGLDALAGIRHCTAAAAEADPSAVVFRLSQPNVESSRDVARMGAVTGAFMLDTIAMDCEQIDETGFAALWQDMADRLDVIGFNSAFSADQFARRFAIPDSSVRFVSRCSTDAQDYGGVADGVHRGGGGILLIGNHYPHKHVREMVHSLANAGCIRPIVAFGVELDEPGVVASYPAGNVPAAVVDGLYRDADVLLFPSHYEGFGLPIMHALACCLPVIARDIPCAREIRDRTPLGANIHLCESTAEMAALAADPPRWTDTIRTPPEPPVSWESAAAVLADAIEAGLARFDFDRCRRRQTPSPVATMTRSTPLQEARLQTLEVGLSLAHADAEQLRLDRDAAVAAVAGARAEVVAAEVAYRGAMAARVSAGQAAAAHAAAVADILAQACGPIVAPVVSSSMMRAVTALGLRDRPIADAVAAPMPSLRFVADEDSDERLRRRLVELAMEQAPGEALRVVVHGADAADRARALLVVAECAVTSLRATRRGAVAWGVRTAQWQALLDAPDDRVFVDAACRLLLGRAVDGRIGGARREVLAAIAASDERWRRAIG